MRNEIIELMRDLYFDEPTARALLIQIGYPPSRIPAFHAAETFWPGVVLNLERGAIKDGICKLLAAAAKAHEGNMAVMILLARAGCGGARPRRVLCLFADPLRSSIALDRESRTLEEIEESIGINIRIRHAVRVSKITELLLRVKPQILHFGGHGRPGGDLLFESDTDGRAPVGPAALARAIAATTTEPLDCIVLNCCFTGANADAFRAATRAVVGSDKALVDDSALIFVRGFYTGIALGQEVEKAFETGCAQLELLGLDRSGLHLVSFPSTDRVPGPR